MATKSIFNITVPQACEVPMECPRENVHGEIFGIFTNSTKTVFIRNSNTPCPKNVHLIFFE